MNTVLIRSSRLAVVAALPLLVAARPLPAPVIGGTTYEFVVRARTAQGGDKESVMMRGRGAFAGSDGRIEILETASPAGSEVFGGKGSYFLVHAGRKMILVDPTNKQYMEWDMANMLAGMSKMVNAMGGLMKFELSDIKIESHNLGAGENLQGYPTVHYQMIENYTMNVKIFGRGSKSHNETTIDYYFAPSLNLANPFMSNSRAMAQSFDLFNNPDYKAQMTAAQARIQWGVPLKTVVKTVSTDDKGKQQVSTVISEMINFHHTDLPSSMFAIPADYKQIEMPKLDANVAAGGSGDAAGGAKPADINADSISKAAKDSAKAGVKDAAKEAAKEAGKQKLRGIFKR
jgi:hypothetical protein